MSFEIVTKQLDDISVMYIPKKITMEQVDEVGQAFNAASSYITQNGCEITDSFMLYSECTEEEMNVDCCMAVKTLLPESEEIKAKVVPGGEFLVARAVYKGPYSGISKTWEDLMIWIQKEGYSFDNVPMREIYLNMPMQVPENELLTEIIVPVKKN